MKNFLLLFFLLLPLPAFAGEALLSSQVEIDVTGKDAADAREQAMAKGEADALLDLLNKLATPDQANAQKYLGHRLGA